MEELRLSHAWPPLARFCAAAAFFVGVSVMVGCGGGGGSPSVDAPRDNVDNTPPPIAFEADDIATLPTDIAANEDVYTLNVRSQSPRTIAIAVEGGDSAFTVTQNSLAFTVGERSKPVTLQAAMAINDIFATDNTVVAITLEVFDALVTARLTIRFVSAPRVKNASETFTLNISPRTILPEGATILPTESVAASIFHLFDAKARYELEQPERPQPPYFAADPDSGKIWLARDLPIGDSTLLTLRSIYRGLTATQFIEVRHLVLPVAVDLANDIAILPSGLEAGRVAYTFNVQSRDRRVISIAVEGGAGYFGVAPNLLDFDVGERSKPVTLTTVIPTDEIFKADNRTVNMTFRLRDVADPLAATRFTIGFISQPRVTSMDGTVTVIRPRTSLTAGATILPTVSVALSIFHLHGATARYELEQPQPPLGQSQSPYFAADLDNGKITLARALPVGDYTLTLRLIYEGLTATRSVSVRSEYLQPAFAGTVATTIYFPASTGADAEVLQVTVTGDDVTVFVDSLSLPIRARRATVREENGDKPTVVYRVEFESPLTSIITADNQKVYLTLRAQGALMESTVFSTAAFTVVEIASGPLGFGRDDTLIIPVGRSGVALPAGEAGITIWHIAFPGRTTHTIDQSDDNLFTVDVASGQISIVDVLENRSEHDLTLRMIGYGYEGVGPLPSFDEAEGATLVTVSRPLRIIGPPHQTVFLSEGTHTITVAAMARPGEEIVVLRSDPDRAFVSLAPLAAGDFQTDGGATARIRLGGRGALELFTADGTELTVGYQAYFRHVRAVDGESRVFTLVFRSAPLVAENGGDLLTVLEGAQVTTADAIVVTEAQASEADIWHYPTPEMIREGVSEEYALSRIKVTNLDQLDESTFTTGLFSVDAETGEVVAAATLEYNRAYEFVLYLRGGGVEAFRNVRVETPPYPSFYAQENAEKGKGTKASPHLIYDIYQLQAIDGAMPADVAAALAAQWKVSEDFVQNEAAETFGEGRLTLRYRLAGDIDASPTRAWAQGFGPIGGSDDGFSGVFDGFSFLIRELHIRRPLEDDVGLFAALESGAEVLNLGLQNVEILGDERVGGFAGAMRGGALSVNWISGLVSGNDDVGGFAGWQTSGLLEENWSSARVDSSGDGGGWVGRRAAGEAGRGYWAGVFAGDVGDFRGRDNLGGLSSPLGAVGGEAVFWNPQASAPGLAQSGGGAVAVGAIQGLLANDFGGGWRAGVGGARDFPVLLGASGSEQAIGIALGMTRLVGIENGKDVILRLGANGARIDLSPEFGWLRLDANGFIARDVADFASARCEVYDDDEGLPRARAAAGYNGVEILVDLLAEDALLSYSEECRFGWSGVERNADITLRLILAAPAVAAGGAARHTVDYAARFAATDISGFDSPAFLTGLPRGVVTIGAAAAANTYSFTVTMRDPVLLGTTMEISSGAAVESAVGVLETGGGRIAAITLAMEATALFTEDNAEAKGNVVLVEGGQRQPHEVRFVSGPRAISFIDGDVFTVHLPARVPRLVDDLRDRLQVWHYEGETYSITVLGAADAELFTLDGSRVSVVGGGLLPGLYTIDVEVEGGDEVAGDDVSLSGRMIVDVAPPTYAARAVTVAAGLPPDQAIITLAVADGVLKRNSFAFLPFDEDMFSTGGGEEAVITMNRDQASFADEQIFTLALTLSQDGRAIIASVEVRSAPSFELLAAFEGSYSVPVFTGETAAGNGAAISIGFRHLFGATPDPSHFWISGAATNYFRLGADLDLEHIRNVFFSDLPVANGAVGSITVSGALSYDDGGSLVATGRETREFQIAIGFAGDSDDESVAIAVDGLVSTIAWTIDNAYDYTHTVSVTIGGSATMTVIDLREVGDVTLDGSSEAKALPIFNIWQLQAIDGREVVNGTLSTDNFTLFGMDDSERLSQHYRIMNDIDATPLASVVHVSTVTIGSIMSGTNRRPRMAITSTITAGFSPIGEELLIVDQFDELDESTFSPTFTGGLYGDGFVVSGLRFVSSVIYNRYPAGLITRLGGGGLISGVRLEDAIVAAFPNGSPGASAAMGGLVALQQANSKIVASRFSGDVFVYPDNNAINIGGLVGNSNSAVIIDSGSSGRVGVNSSSAENVGGLVGTYHLRGKIIRSWSSADVGGNSGFGGLVGLAHLPSAPQTINIETSIEGAWTAGRLTRSANSPGGLYHLDTAIAGTFMSPAVANVWTASEVSAESYPLGRARGNHLVSLGYWSRDLAPVGYRRGGSSGEGVDDIRTLNPSHFSGDLWDFGTDSDFPLLNNQLRSEQAAQIASGISKIVGRNGGTVVLGDDLSIDHLTRGASFILGSAYAELELDTNGRASGANDMPAPSCEFSNNEVRANTNYNNAAVAMTLDAPSGLNWIDRGACAVSWTPIVSAMKFTVRMIVSSTYGTETTILTINYPAEITAPNEFATPPLRIEAFAERELAPTLAHDGVLLLSLRGGVNGEDDIIVRATGNGKVTILPIPSGDNFHTDGGVSWATISVFNAGSNDIFAGDNQLRSVVVSATDGDGESETVTLTLAAIPELVYNDFSNLTINLPVSPGQTILAAEDLPLVWRHALYGLESNTITLTRIDDPDSNPFSVEFSGDRDTSNNHILSADPIVDPAVYPISIRYDVTDYKGVLITDSARSILTVTFVDSTEAFSLRRTFDGAAYPWTRDEAYSYRVTMQGENGIVEVDLLQLNEDTSFDGSSEDLAIPIYNVWQLQAIAGVSVNAAGSVSSSGAVIFGSNRLDLRYDLMNDIDADPAREWDGGKGFTPIGDPANPFLGRFDGGGNVVQNLFIDRATITIGLFGAVGEEGVSKRGYVSDLGVSNAEYRGSGDIGGVIGVLAGKDNSMNELWFSGRIFQSSPSHYAGGIVGRQRQTNTFGVDRGYITGAWAAGEIEVAGGPETAGGIVGRLDSDGSFGADLEWVSYIASPIGGVYGSIAINLGYIIPDAYVSREISALPADLTVGVVESLQTLARPNLFRDTPENGFPVFGSPFSPSQQAINIAAGLTRIRDKDGTALALDGTIPARNFGRMQLDTNGLAANDGSAQTAMPDCVFVDDALRARTNYNQVAVIMTLLAAPTGVYFSHRGGCDVFWVGANENVTATVRLIFSSAVAADALTVDYIVRPDDSLPFVTPNEIIVPADYQPDDPEDTPFSFVANPEYTRINVVDSNDFAAIDGVAQDGTLSVGVLRSAASIFDYDNAVKVIALELTNLSNGEPNEEEPYTQEISARSSPRLASSLDALFVNLPVIAGGTLAAKPLEIWHLDDEGDEFRIASDDDGDPLSDGLPILFEQNGALISTLDVNKEDGHTIRVEAVNGTLTLPADGNGAEGVIQFVVGEHEKLRRALAATIRWTPENAYNYEFAVTNDDGEEVMIDLRVLGDNVLDGLTPRLPFPIYNIWQLQAASGAGELPPDALTLEFSARERASVLFGANAEERLGRHYRLMSDIDAYPTRNWGDSGFIPLGDADTPFAGSLDGNGKVVRGLYSRHNDASMMGVLAGAVSNLGVEDALIIADGDDAQIGALAASVAFGGRIEGSWATGRGDGGDSVDYSFGGLAGAMAPGAAIEGSWAAVDMTDAEGEGDSAGGLVGELNGVASQSATLRLAWTAGDIAVDGIDRAGGALGFAGYGVGGVWSVGEVEANDSDAVGGFVGVLNAPTDNSFWSPEISGLPDEFGRLEDGGNVSNIISVNLQTLALSPVGPGVFTSPIGYGFDLGGTVDFPLITLFEQSKARQVAHLARALTQINGAGDAAFPRYADGLLRLSRTDYPHLTLAADAPIESCAFADGAITASLGYNGAMARLSLPNPGASGARFAYFAAAAPDNGHCRVDLSNVANNVPFVVRWEIWSENDESGYTLTVDYSVAFQSPRGEIEAPDGVVVVPADASTGNAINAPRSDPVLTLFFPGGVMNRFTESAFASDGGKDQAVIRLTRPAVMAFPDNVSLELVVETKESIENDLPLFGPIPIDDAIIVPLTHTATILFRSAPLGFNAQPMTVDVEENQAKVGYALSLSVYLSIWHNDDNDEYYDLSQPYDDFAINSTTGVITARRDFVGEIPMTVRLRDAPSGVDAKIAFRLRVNPNSSEAAKRLFERMIERGEVDWLADSDGDGTINAYDWTPYVTPATVEVDLLGGANGMAGNPWPIYNVWQLQAIAGKVVSAEGKMSDGNLFGANRLSAHYRLTTLDIDATPTRAWDDGKGFSPIGDSANPFTGDFDGKGKAVKGIYIDRALDQIGIFAVAEGARIVSLGVEDGRIGGNVSVAAGGIVGEARSVEIIDSWFSGRIETAGNGAIGGLAGILTISTDANKLAGAWVAGRIESSGAAAVAGGVIGKTGPSTAAIEFPGVWSVAEVMAVTVGGVIGEHARPVIDFSRSSSITAYWSVETSGVDNSDGNSAGIRTAQTLRAAQISVTDGDGADVGSINDFPLLNAFSRARQAVNIAAGLTRILPRDGGVERGLPRGYADLTTLAAEFRVLEFDSNGLAANDVSARSSAPSCVFADGGLRAAMNYNNVAVSLSLLSDSGASLRDIGAKGDCLFGWRDVRDETALTLRAVFSSDYGGVDSVRSTFDYRLTIAAGTAERLNDSSAVVNDESAAAATETTPARAFAEALANDYLPRVYGGIGVADSPLLPLPVETTFPPTGDVVLRIDDDDNPNTALACAANSGGLSARSQYGMLVFFKVENADGNLVGTASGCRITIPATAAGEPFTAVLTFEIGEGETRRTITRRHRITR